MVKISHTYNRHLTNGFYLGCWCLQRGCGHIDLALGWVYIEIFFGRELTSSLVLVCTEFQSTHYPTDETKTCWRVYTVSNIPVANSHYPHIYREVGRLLMLQCNNDSTLAAQGGGFISKGSLWSSGLSSDNSIQELTLNSWAKSLLNSQKSRGTASPPGYQICHTICPYVFTFYLLCSTCFLWSTVLVTLPKKEMRLVDMNCT